MDALLNAYFELHDMLSDMIEGGRLTEGDIPDDYAALVKQLEQCNARYEEMMRFPGTYPRTRGEGGRMMEDFDSRWACPECGSKDVEIALPMWCTEDMNGDLAPRHIDEEAEPLYWLCNTCEASDRGSPVDLLED